MPRDPNQTFRISFVALRFVMNFLFLAVPFGGLAWYGSGHFGAAVPYVIFGLVFATVAAVRAYLQLGKMMRKIEADKAAAEAEP